MTDAVTGVPEVTNRTRQAACPDAESSASALHALARQSLAAGNLPSALSLLEDAVRLNPGQGELWVAIAEVLLQLNEITPALDCLRQAILLEPDLISTRVVLGNLQKQLGNFPAAAAQYREVLAAAPHTLSALVNLASVLRSQGNSLAAVEFLEQAERLTQNSAVEAALVAFNLGNTLVDLGRFFQACECYERALQTHPRPARVLFNLSQTRRFQESDRLRIAHWQTELPASAPTSEDQVHLHFAFGKMADDLGDYDQAFEHYQQGNHLLPAAFDPEQHARQMSALRTVWNSRFFAERADWGPDTAAPIFIVGMPRSGTTLVEQVLAAHSDVQALGERPTLGILLTRLSDELGCPDDLLETARRAVQADLHELHLHYLAGTRAGTGQRIVDKMPGNFLHLGWILTAFPEARILYCTRDPRDTCLSCYFQHFTQSIPYASRLEHLAAFQRETQRQMEHWQALAGESILTVNYERLTESPEQMIRQILEFCGLSVNAAEPETTPEERAIQTASAWQVRQPIYQTSRARWKHYARHLDVLLQAFGDGEIAV